MRQRFKLRAVLMLAGGLLLGGSLPAQEPTDSQARERPPMDHGMMGMTDMMSMMDDCPMMAAARQGPRAALGQRKELALTDAQVTRLEKLAAREKEAQTKPVARMRALHKELGALTSRERLDSTAVRGVLERMGRLHADMGLAMLRAQHETGVVLTPDQRRTLAKGAKGTMGMHGDMEGGMMGTEGKDMQGCPMMHDSTNARPGKPNRSGPSQTKPAPPPGAEDHHGHEPTATPS